jgi:hypothetical protein
VKTGYEGREREREREREKRERRQFYLRELEEKIVLNSKVFWPMRGCT